MADCFACMLAVAGSSLTVAPPSGTGYFRNDEGGHFKLDKSHARIVFSTARLGFSTCYDFIGDLDAKACFKTSGQMNGVIRHKCW